MQIETLRTGDVTVWIADAAPTEKPLPINKQRETIGLLLKAAGLQPTGLSHTPEGKPFLTAANGLHISITHTQSHIAIALCAYPVGIDIEAIGPRTRRVLPRITEAKERALLQERSDEAEATRVWCAKEAVFKLYGTQARAMTDICLTAFNQDTAESAAPYAAKISFLERRGHILAVATEIRQGLSESRPCPTPNL
ncbi:MAG: 4'-phosphopantetheinyl transferase superfamily protein [Bacteroidaceae bacterium]|nr:4'-phosphopantetheinyl transferase superfamily protein [Bacteroidaceae bacterium]